MIRSKSSYIKVFTDKTIRLVCFCLHIVIVFCLLTVTQPLFSQEGSADTNTGALTPKRVVSMNLCTDQLAMLLAGPGQLLSVSNLTLETEGSVMVEEAQKYKINYGLAEEVFLMKPDIILAGFYTTRSSIALLQRLGFRVEIFPLAHSFDDIRNNIKKMGNLLNRNERADELIRDFDNALANFKVDKTTPAPLAALYYANSYTSGSNTLANDIVTAAQFKNLSSHLNLKGFRRFPLELLIYNTPDLIVTSQKWSDAPALAQQSLQHPALVHLQKQSGLFPLADKYWICGTPFVTEAVRNLVSMREQLTKPRQP